MNERTENLQRLTVWMLLAGVAFGAVYTVTRMYSAVFMMIQMPYDDSLIASFVVVGSVLIALIIPDSWLSRFIFTMLSLSIFGGMAAALARPLGLLDMYPLFWRWVLLLAGSIPFAMAAVLYWSFKRPMEPKVKMSESRRNFRSLSGKSDRKRLRVARPPKAIGEPKPIQLLANPESESDDETAESLAILNTTVYTVSKHRGNMAAAAKELKLTPPGVSERLKRLYKLNPEQVQRHAPDWVKRNIKD